MASTKLQKPTNEEHKFSQKISEMTAWGTKVFGHKNHEHQAPTKHCITCQCQASKDTKPTCVDSHKKEHETKKKEKNEQETIVHKDAIGLKKKEKQHIPNIQMNDSKQPEGVELNKKEKKENHAKNTTNNARSTFGKKYHKDEGANHCFSSMADHWKEKIKMMKKGKDEKYRYSSSSESEDESSEIKKTHKKQSQKT